MQLEAQPRARSVRTFGSTAARCLRPVVLSIPEGEARAGRRHGLAALDDAVLAIPGGGAGLHRVATGRGDGEGTVSGLQDGPPADGGDPYVVTMSTCATHRTPLHGSSRCGEFVASRDPVLRHSRAGVRPLSAHTPGRVSRASGQWDHSVDDSRSGSRTRTLGDAMVVTNSRVGPEHQPTVARFRTVFVREP